MAESNNKNTTGASHFAGSQKPAGRDASGTHFGGSKPTARVQPKTSSHSASGSVKPTKRTASGSRFASGSNASGKVRPVAGSRFGANNSGAAHTTRSASQQTSGSRFSFGKKNTGADASSHAAGSASRTAAGTTSRTVGATSRTSAGAHGARTAAPASQATTQMPTLRTSAASGTRTMPAATTASGVKPVSPVRSKAKSTRTSAGGNGSNVPPRGRNSRGVAAGGKDNGRGGNSASAKRKQILPIAMIVVGVVLLLVAGGLFIKAQLGYQQAQSTYSDLQQYAIQSEDGDQVPNVDFDALAAINSDIVGWIYIPGTNINYPVVQTSDNSTYLTKLFDQTGNGSGTIFMDMDDTAPGMVDQQTTIYGHHMNDGSMFKFIDNTLNQSDFDTIGNVYYITRDTTYVLQPMFTAQVEDTYIAARTANFTDGDTTLQSYLEDMLSQAKAKSSTASEDIKSVDKVLTLVTCAGEIIPRTTRAAMVLKVVETQDRTATTTDGSTDGATDEAAATDGTDAAATDATTEGEQAAA